MHDVWHVHICVQTCSAVLPKWSHSAGESANLNCTEPQLDGNHLNEIASITKCVGKEFLQLFLAPDVAFVPLQRLSKCHSPSHSRFWHLVQTVSPQPRTAVSAESDRHRKLEASLPFRYGHHHGSGKESAGLQGACQTLTRAMRKGSPPNPSASLNQEADR